MGLLPFRLGTTRAVAADGFSEPATLLYGKVVHVDEGSTFQVASGDLQMTLVNTENPANSITVTAELGEVGAGGVFSYALMVPQKVLPAPDELDAVLEVGQDDTLIEIRSMTLDGVTAAPLDAAQGVFFTSFANRAVEHRLDLRVNLPQADSDGDGMPDWWEDLYGLNLLFAGDAEDDLDEDGFTNLTEFMKSTDPNSSNKSTLPLTTSLLVPVGGSAGFFLNLVDADSAPPEINLEIVAVPTGLTFMSSTGVVTGGFTYADVLAGTFFLEVEPSFEDGLLEVRIIDTVSPDPTDVPPVFPDPFVHPVLVQAFSPAASWGPQPALWLTADGLVGQVPDLDPVAEWQDLSGNNRNGYQSVPLSSPIFEEAVPRLVFDGEDVMYLDDRDLELDRLTVFLAFDLTGWTESNLTVVSTVDVAMELGGSDTVQAHTLRVVQNGRVIPGPVMETNTGTQVTLVGGEHSSYLTVQGGSMYVSSPSTDVLPPVFSTLGGRQLIADTGVGQHLLGGISEVLIYDQQLEPEYQSRNEDYQISRWGSLVVWDHRNETARLRISGQETKRNAINGGWGSDTLEGGGFDDILRGGPGSDILTGKSGADRFQFFPGRGDDIVTDFVESDGDIIDLSPIFFGRRGSPSDFIDIQFRTSRDSNDLPRVDTILEFNDGGSGVTNLQTVTLEGVPYSSTDLMRLVGEGVIQLGGPQFETDVSLAASETELVETEIARTLIVTRAGNLDAALDLHLSFSGSAEASVDYHVANAIGTGILRTVSFAQGESTKHLELTPIQDALEESEAIRVTVIAKPQITGIPETPLLLSLEDAPLVRIQTLVGTAQWTGPVPGIIQLTREGSLDAPMDVGLDFLGDAINGNDYDLISPTFTFPAGVASAQLQLVPRIASLFTNVPVVAQVDLVPDKTRFAVASPGSAVISIINSLEDQSATFQTWRNANFPGDESADLMSRDSDGDRIDNGWEYIVGTNPNVPNESGDCAINLVLNEAGALEVQALTANGLVDVTFSVECSSDLTTWQSADSDLHAETSRLPDGRVLRVFKSMSDLGSLEPTVRYRLNATVNTSKSVYRNQSKK